MGRLDGKVAIITGSTSGMGRDTAYLFAKEGAKVVVTGRNEERAKAAVEKIRNDGGEAIYVIADTSDRSAAKKIYDETMKAYGTVDILINNAGKLSLTPVQEMTLEEWDSVFNVNLTSALLLTQYCEPELKKNKGHIVNISSVAGTAGSLQSFVGNQSVYLKVSRPALMVTGACFFGDPAWLTCHTSVDLSCVASSEYLILARILYHSKAR